MAAKRTRKKVKKITEIPEAKVTIEVEQTEDKENEAIVTTAPQEAEINDEKTKENSGESENQTLEDGETIESPEVDSTETVEEKEPFSDDPGTGDSFSWKKVIIFAVISAVVGFIIVGGFLYIRTGYKINISKNSDSKTLVVPTKKPTPTPEPVDKTAYQIQVLNGSGIAGEAAAVQEILEDAGFEVSSIGNADNQNYTNTVIAVSKDVKDGFTDELKAALEKRGPVEVEDLSSEENGDVVVTVGSDLNNEITPTP